MTGSDEEPDVEGHLRALDEEIARLKKLEAAMDRRLEEAEEQRRSIEREIEGEADPERRRGDA
jgi:hypothetical protein